MSLFSIFSYVFFFIWEPSKLHIEFPAALAGHHGFDSLSQVLRGSAQIFHKPVCQILRERSRTYKKRGWMGRVWLVNFLLAGCPMESSAPSGQYDLGKEYLPNIEDILANSYGTELNDLYESWACAL